MNRTTKSIVSMLVFVGAVSPVARADITITSGRIDVFTNGSAGRNGSSTGTLGDDPPEVNGTSGVVRTFAHTSAGPVPPAEPPSEILPGTTGQIDAISAGRLQFNGDSQRMQIHASIVNVSDMINMDGGNYGSNAQGVLYYNFDVTTPTPYTFSGFAAFDDEDIVGSIVFNGHFIFLGTNGPFSYSGVLAPGSYTFSSGAYLGSGAAGAPGFGNFYEQSYFFTTLALGEACDASEQPTITQQPQDAGACASVNTAFSVAAGGLGPFSYEWQMELPPPSLPGTWMTLTATPMALACGGTVKADPPDLASTNILVAPCDDVTKYHVRCVVSSACGSVASHSAVYTVVKKGDMNCDCRVDGLDIQPFVIAIQSAGAYATNYPGCDITNGDMDGNATVDEFDLPGFVDRLLSGG